MSEAEPFPTWALFRDIRRRMLLVCEYVPEVIGDGFAAEKQHKMGQILSVQNTEPTGSRYTSERYVMDVTRTLVVQAFYSMGSEDRSSVTESAGRFFDDLRSAILTYREDLYGEDTGFAASYKLRFAGEPLPLGREGGYLVYELRISSGLPIGPPPKEEE